MNRWWFPYDRRRTTDAAPSTPALETERVTVVYPGTTRLALREITLRVERGSRVGLVGPNGAGKSTLLKAVAGLLPVTAGRIRVWGHPVGSCRHLVAYLPQRGDIDWSFPVSLSRFVLAGRFIHLGWFRRPGRDDHDRVAAELDRFGLSELAEQPIGRLSGGQQQRALLARALVQGAELLLLDEPFNALDPDTREAIYELLTALKNQGKTLLVATHDHARLSDAFDQVIHLQHGSLLATAPVEPLLPSLGTEVA